jgi:HK97 family phage prohead protease
VLINFSANIVAAESNSRTLSGTIVPFGGEVGNTSAGAVTFEAGSFVELDPSKVKLLLEHDRTRPVGVAKSFQVTESGIDATFSVAETTAGNDLLVEAAQGLRDGFSVGANVLDYRYEQNVMVVTAAELMEVSAVTYPAFSSARVADVAASESTDEAEQSEQGETAVEIETTHEVVEEVAAPVVEASATPIYTAPRVKPLTAGEALAHAVYAAKGSEDSRRMLVEAADDTSNNTGFTLSKGLPQFLTSTFGSRPAIDAVGGAQALPATGMSYTIPRLTAAPSIEEVAELDPTPNDNLTSDYISIDVKKFSGMNVVSQELLERSDPSFGDILLRELRRAYATATDKAVLAELLNGSSGANQAASWEGLQAFIATEAPNAYVATGGEIADRLIASSAWWTEILGAKDNADRPIFTAMNPQNAGGVAGIAAPRGEVFGAQFYVDHNISTVGLIDNSAFLVSPDSVGVWESPAVQLSTNVLTDGSVQISLHGYLATKVLKSGGVRKFMIA